MDASVHVPVMNVRVMRMVVPDADVGVQVAVRGACVGARFMRVLVVFIVAVFVCMRQFLMDMRMGMVLGQVQPDPQSHQRRRQPERP